MQITRWIVLQKARRHPAKGEAPTPCTHIISCSISLPSRGSFHLSLAVLVLYRSHSIFSLGGWTPQIQSGFHVSRPTRQPVMRQNLKVFLIVRFTLCSFS